MHAHKAQKVVRARAVEITMIDRGREEELLLQRWADSDRERGMDDLDSDDSLDRFELASVGARPGSERFDA